MLVVLVVIVNGVVILEILEVYNIGIFIVWEIL